MPLSSFEDWKQWNQEYKPGKLNDVICYTNAFVFNLKTHPFLSGVTFLVLLFIYIQFFRSMPCFKKSQWLWQAQLYSWYHLDNTSSVSLRPSESHTLLRGLPSQKIIWSKSERISAPCLHLPSWMKKKTMDCATKGSNSGTCQEGLFQSIKGWEKEEAGWGWEGGTWKQ